MSDKKTPHRPKVYVVGGGIDYIRLMYTLNCDGAKGVEDADVVLFTGGEDVNPALYGELPLAKTHFSVERDAREKLIYEAALKRGIPMVGICRGGQFLNVMNGGKMWQHVNMHALAGTHKAFIEVAPYNKNKTRREIQVTSTHHQMMIPAKHGMVLLTATEATEKDCAGKSVTGKIKTDPDVEAVFYDDTDCLCFQPHPEYKNAPTDCVDFFEECLDNFIFPRLPLKGETETAKAIIDQIPPKIGKKGK